MDRALKREGNVTRAARRLAVSQSTLSHGLARLRDMFKDDLFVRTGRGISPTPRALELAPRIASILAETQGLFASNAAFNPASAEARISVASTEYFEHIALPRLVPRLATAAPHVTLHSLSTQGQLPKEAMEKGTIDLAIAGFFGDLPEGFHRQKLFTDTFRILAHRDHPIAQKRRITVEDYCAYEHILISPQGDMKSVIDAALGKKHVRRIVAGISNFLTPAWVVAESNLLLTAPRRLVDMLTKTLPVVALDLPIESPKLTIYQVWHQRVDGHPLHRWFRSLVKDCVDDQ